MTTFVSEQANMTTTSLSLPTYVSPTRLLIRDLKLVWKLRWDLPKIILPLTPNLSGPLDELAPTWANRTELVFHTVLVVAQLGFLASIPLCLVLPLVTFLLYFVGFVVANYLICIYFNGSCQTEYMAAPKTPIPGVGKNEKWIFINGVSVGRHWLNGNLQRLADTFRREIFAVHNPTYGIIFDLIQCLIERDLSYDTCDIRQAYTFIKRELMSEKNTKVVLILHSQGGIEGGMVIDWLLADVPETKMKKLEVYTFGNAANHFNNPVRRSQDDYGAEAPDYCRTISHIEHYANEGDFVARFGVLEFAKRLCGEHESRFVGQVFQRAGTGHLLCQHYLNYMFAMKDNKVVESNPFMDSLAWVDQSNSDAKDTRRTDGAKIKDISRLWHYRNGGSPH
ncbi:hypothetical protein BP6252_07661 [Coleophoma cylindrospora]|uniref:DUF676 domain-containing protein n=1 Tax=Coleophoma cylindrospora TaxID=1849047 RepID=A0A3D8RB00_9HELO|nr:hypothetical protein BP6252_07661 [Coleophoma cylindrospora]